MEMSEENRKIKDAYKKPRLQVILAYELSGQRSYAACDIVTREAIDRLIPKILKATG